MTEVLAPQSYRDIAALHGRRALLYVEFGSYQGEWLMLASDAGHYYIYEGWYGSCSGCDAIQAKFHGDYAPTEKVQEFSDGYRPFAVIPKDTMRRLALNETLSTVFPKNVGNGSDVPGFAREAELIVRLEENLEVTSEMALASNNQETRRRIMERIGIEQFVTKEITTEDSGDRLVNLVDGGRYLWLQDSSTDREYLLRVPPEIESVREGKAWSFALDPEEYAPEIET